jgi:hypothetical protein
MATYGLAVLYRRAKANTINSMSRGVISCFELRFFLGLEALNVSLQRKMELANFIETIKESLTDAQYKEGLELCMKAYNSEEKLYRMTYMRPMVFREGHCEDCDEVRTYVSFTKCTALVLFGNERAERVRSSNLFKGTFEEMESFVHLDVLHAFPEDLDIDLEWFDFPVVGLEEVSFKQPQEP